MLVDGRVDGRIAFLNNSSLVGIEIMLFRGVGVGGTSQQGKKKVRKSRQGAAEPIMVCPSIGERALESCPVFYFYFFGVTFSCEGSVKCRCAWWAVDDV